MTEDWFLGFSVGVLLGSIVANAIWLWAGRR